MVPDSDLRTTPSCEPRTPAAACASESGARSGPGFRNAVCAIPSPTNARKQARARAWGATAFRDTWRAQFAQSVAAGLTCLSFALSSPPAGATDGLPGSSPGCTTSVTNPSYTIVSCDRTGLDRNGRLLGCRVSEPVKYHEGCDIVAAPHAGQCLVFDDYYGRRSLTTTPGLSLLQCLSSEAGSLILILWNPAGLDVQARKSDMCSSSENCVSTSAVNVPGKLGSPWEYALQTEDGDRAFASLVRAVEDASGASVQKVDTTGLYILAQFPSKVPPGGVDSVEFLVKPADRIVLYRSFSRDTLFIYPVQRPVSDEGTIRDRLEGIRKELGWGMYTYQGQ